MEPDTLWTAAENVVTSGEVILPHQMTSLSAVTLLHKLS